MLSQEKSIVRVFVRVKRLICVHGTWAVNIS
jgi:hypothetical protein